MRASTASRRPRAPVARDGGCRWRASARARARWTIRRRGTSDDEVDRVESGNDGGDGRGSRRDVVLAAFASSIATLGARDADAGEVLDSLTRMREDARLAYEEHPEDDVLKGQLNFFDKQVEKTRANADFLSEIRPMIESGRTNYLGGISFAVTDVQAEIDFWTKALGMRVTRDVGSGAERVATLAYGQSSLTADDGGKGVVEIRQATGDASDVGNVLSYVAVTVPFGLRVSQIYESGGELLYGFGFFDMRSPGGIPIRGQVATRRDPLEVVALNVQNVRAAEKFLISEFGFKTQKPLDENGYAPKSPSGSRLLYFVSPMKTFTLILQPWRDRKTPLRVGNVLNGVVVARGGDATMVNAVADARVATVPILSRPVVNSLDYA